MTNLEKLKAMKNAVDFAAAVAATATTFKRIAKPLDSAPPALWGSVYAMWLKEFLESPYEGAFDKDDKQEDKTVDEIIDEMMSERRGNPFFSSAIAVCGVRRQ